MKNVHLLIIDAQYDFCDLPEDWLYRGVKTALPVVGAHAHMERALEYLGALEAAGNYKLIAWPPHCQMGSVGHTVHESVLSAYNAWEDLTKKSVSKVLKGLNPWTEHYSAAMSEVPDPADE